LRGRRVALYEALPLVGNSNVECLLSRILPVGFHTENEKRLFVNHLPDHLERKIPAISDIGNARLKELAEHCSFRSIGVRTDDLNGNCPIEIKRQMDFQRIG
jgi:hypothetical protein